MFLKRQKLHFIYFEPNYKMYTCFLIGGGNSVHHVSFIYVHTPTHHYLFILLLIWYLTQSDLNFRKFFHLIQDGNTITIWGYLLLITVMDTSEMPEYKPIFLKESQGQRRKIFLRVLRQITTTTTTTDLQLQWVSTCCTATDFVLRTALLRPSKAFKDQINFKGW